MKLLVFGVTGMLGHKVYETAKKKGIDVYGTSREPLGDGKVYSGIDITQKSSVESVVKKVKPDVVINCAGLIKPLCKDVAAIYTNSVAPHLIAGACSTYKSRMIHVSTDCVFSGSKGNYSETDYPDALDLYGRSKLLGEIYDRPDVLTIRTSFIGKEPKEQKYGLVDWFLSQKGEVNGYTNAHFTGLTNTALAEVLLKLAERAGINGLLHVGGEKWSKYDILIMIKETFGLDTKINRYDGFFCDRSLDSSKLKSLGFRVPGMRKMIVELKADYDSY